MTGKKQDSGKARPTAAKGGAPFAPAGAPTAPVPGAGVPALTLTAHRLHANTMPLVVGESARDWMDATPNRFAYRCLPMLIANQAGWYVLAAHTVAVTWDGGDGLDALKIECRSGQLPCPAISSFGSGIMTWTIPYLFRTPPGYNMLVRGPANWPKDGIAALEGIVETDWTESTFTMNWKLTRPNHPVTFQTGEPVAMLVPQPRGELELFRPEVRDIDAEPELRDSYESWAKSRRAFNEDLHKPGSEAQKRGWQKHYAQGKTIGEVRSREHQSKLALRAFSDEKSATGSPPPKAGPNKN